VTDTPAPSINGNTREQLAEVVEAAFAQAPLVYANGFVNGLNVSDSYVVLQTNGRSVAVVSMPLAMAKSLGQNLVDMVQAYEQRSGETVPTLDDLRARAS